MQRTALWRLLTTLLVLGFVVFVAAGSTARWLGLGPYGPRIDGVVVDKVVVTKQGRGTRVEYLLVIRDGKHVSRVEVSPEMFREVGPGWDVEKRGLNIVATSPDGSTVVATMVN